MKLKILLILLSSLIQFQFPKNVYSRHQEKEFSLIQKKFIDEHTSKAQLFWFNRENLLVAYEDGYLSCLKNNTEFNFGLEVYSDNEYNQNIMKGNLVIGRLYLNSEFNPENLVLSNKKFSEKIGITELKFNLERKLSEN